MAQAAVTGFDDWDELSDAHIRVIEAAARANFFRSLGWFRALCATSLDAGDAVRIYSIGDPPRLILPMRRPAHRNRLRPRRLTSLANFYSCDFAPLSADGTPRAADIASIAARLRQERPCADVVDLTSMSCPDIGFDAVERGFLDAGWWVQRYFHFGNWFEPTAGVGPDDYLAARQPALRNTLKRKAAALAKAKNVRIELITGTPGRDEPDLDRAIDAYERVYRRSWKLGEPYPHFSAAFIRTCAADGCLRLGLVHIGDEPAAAQIWIVWQGRATMCKLAHDERFKAMSVGTVLMWRLMDHVLRVDRVREVDFGRGDDGFKQLWMSQRREHWGLLAFNPSTPLGLTAAARHIGGRQVARYVRPLRDRLIGRRP